MLRPVIPLLGALCLSAVEIVRAQEARAWPDVHHAQVVGLAGRSAIELNPSLTIGSEDDSAFTFGFLTDATQAPDGSIFALDPTEHRIVAFDSLGHFRGWIGQQGAGPGELLSPFRIALLSDTLIVYDRQLARVSYFATSGRFIRSWQIQVPTITAFAAGPDQTLLITVPGQGHRVYQYSKLGVRERSFIQTPAIDKGIRGPYSPEPGAVCALSRNTFVYANPWVYELAGFDPATGRTAWALEDEALALSPQPSDLPRVSPLTQRGAILGLECSPALIVFSYLDRRSATLWYDFLDPNGNLIARLQFPGPPASGYPGFLGSLRGNRLLTFRTKPFPQVIVYRITGRPSQ